MQDDPRRLRMIKSVIYSLCKRRAKWKSRKPWKRDSDCSEGLKSEGWLKEEIEVPRKNHCDQSEATQCFMAISYQASGPAWTYSAMGRTNRVMRKLKKYQRLVDTCKEGGWTSWCFSVEVNCRGFPARLLLLASEWQEKWASKPYQPLHAKPHQGSGARERNHGWKADKASNKAVTALWQTNQG